jgi:hypothetical protein
MSTGPTRRSQMSSTLIFKVVEKRVGFGTAEALTVADGAMDLVKF